MKIPVLGHWVAKVGRIFVKVRALEFRSQPGPHSCDVLRAIGSLMVLAMHAVLTVSPQASITVLNFYFPYPCSFFY